MFSNMGVQSDLFHNELTHLSPGLGAMVMVVIVVVVGKLGSPADVTVTSSSELC